MRGEEGTDVKERREGRSGGDRIHHGGEGMSSLQNLAFADLQYPGGRHIAHRVTRRFASPPADLIYFDAEEPESFDVAGIYGRGGEGRS